MIAWWSAEVMVAADGAVGLRGNDRRAGEDDNRDGAGDWAREARRTNDAWLHGYRDRGAGRGVTVLRRANWQTLIGRVRHRSTGISNSSVGRSAQA